MTLQVPEPPSEVTAFMQSAIQRSAEQRHFRTPSLRTTRLGEQLELTDPHEVYTMGLDDLRTAAGLAAARPVSWRFLVRGADGVVLAAAESTRAANGEYILAEVNEGPFVSATVGTLAALRADARLEPTPFIPQLLHVPALYAMALWLHHDGADDLLVPLAPFPLDLPTGLLMSAADLLGRLELLAASVEVEPAEGTQGQLTTPRRPRRSAEDAAGRCTTDRRRAAPGSRQRPSAGAASHLPGRQHIAVFEFRVNPSRSSGAARLRRQRRAIPVRRR